MTVDAHVEIAELQSQIGEYLGGLDTNQIIFEFSEANQLIALDLITVNPKHRQSFLFHTTKGVSKIDTLKKMLDYVKNYKEKETSYTVQWSLKGENELHTSYFRAKNVMHALEKFYYGRDINNITVFSVVLNPIS
ncbi:MAG: hypothetical protein ACK4K0_00605 [Flavobacteriales bacterium]